MHAKRMVSHLEHQYWYRGKYKWQTDNQPQPSHVIDIPSDVKGVIIHNPVSCGHSNRERVITWSEWDLNAFCIDTSCIEGARVDSALCRHTSSYFNLVDTSILLIFDGRPAVEDFEGDGNVDA